MAETTTDTPSGATALLEVAKQIRRKNGVDPSDAEIELAFAWMRDEINLSQACGAMYPNSTGAERTGKVLYRFAKCFREAYRRGLIRQRSA